MRIEPFPVQGQTNKDIRAARLQRELRRHMTDAEQHLWRHLRRRQLDGFRFRRQHPFEDYILDFVCLEAMLVIEVDGGQHAEAMEQDHLRTGRLDAAGFRVLRFWNNEVLNETDGVVEVIRRALRNPSSFSPSP